MNDDLGFGAFPFDVDFTDSFPVGDFDLSNDPGFPKFWENIDDIIGGGLDFMSKLGEMFKDLWDTVWQGIGGGVRWVYNALEDVIDWSKTVLSIAITNVGDAVSWWFSWMHDRVWDAARWVWDKVEDSAGWVWDAAWNAAGWVWGLAGAAIDWSRTVLSTAITNVGDALSWGLDWLWTMASDAGRGIYGGITGAFGWLHGKVDWWGEALGNVVEGWFDWLWTKASDAYFGITGGVAGGLVWVRDQVVPVVAGAAENIVEGITGGFDKLPDLLLGPLGALGDLIAGGLRWLVEGAFEPMVDVVGGKLAIPGKMLRGEYGSVSEWADDIMDPPPLDNIVKTFGWVLLAIPSLLMSMMPVFQPAMTTMIQDANRDFRPRLLGEAEILDAQLREIPVHYGYDEQLERWGYRDEDILALRTLRQPIPGSTDLIRMGVREVFTPEIAEAFGQFEDFPRRFGELMELVGFGLRPTGQVAGGGPGGGRTWAEAFWAAHWDLPSITQGFEMYHREVTLPDGSTFDEPKLMLLLRALDVMPNWRDPLRQIAYNVVTRVDIRRMYQDGVVDEDKVRQVYRHLGYTPEDADGLTEMVKIRYPRGGKKEGEDLRELTLSTVKQAYVRRLIDRDEALEKLLALDHPEEDAELVLSIWDFDLEWNPSLRFEVPFKDLSRSVITDAYRRGVFDFNRAAVELVEAGYTQDDAEILLQLEDLKLQQELTDMEVDLILQDARAQDITLAEAESRLLGLGLEPARVTFLVRREELRRLTKTRTLTVSQISRAFRDGIFTEDLFLEKVGILGYTADDAAVLLGLEGPVEQAKRQLSRSEVEKLLRRQEITRDNALARLTAMGYLPEDAELVVGSVERQLERTLVERLLEQALLTRAEALDRLVKAGWSSADADLIVRSCEQKMAEEAAEPEPEETPSRELSRTLVEKFLREKLLSRDQALDRLVRAGFTPGDAELIVLSVERKLAAEAEPPPPPTPRELERALVERLMREGLLSRAQALERLIRVGFTPGDAELIVTSVEGKLAEEAAEEQEQV